MSGLRVKASRSKISGLKVDAFGIGFEVRRTHCAGARVFSLSLFRSLSLAPSIAPCPSVALSHPPPSFSPCLSIALSHPPSIAPCLSLALSLCLSLYRSPSPSLYCSLPLYCSSSVYHSLNLPLSLSLPLSPSPSLLHTHPWVSERGRKREREG